MNRLYIASLTLLSAALSSTVFAAPEATVLFAQPGTMVIDAAGVARSVKRGDVLQSGERLSTPPGGISQLKLLDGSLIGLRADSEVKITPPPPAAVDKGLQVVSLTKGAVRVVGAELMDDKKPSRFTLHSGLATLQLKGADLESSITPPSTGPKPAGGADAGSNNRMLVGTGTIASGTTVTPLEQRQLAFVGAEDSPRVKSLPDNLGTPRIVEIAKYNIPGGEFNDRLNSGGGSKVSSKDVGSRTSSVSTLAVSANQSSDTTNARVNTQLLSTFKTDTSKLRIISPKIKFTTFP
jgi:hypothetical protein